MIKLNELNFIPGSMKKRKRVARGNSGKATGRGLKGQKARSGVSLKNFQGGQTPIERRVPKHNNFYVSDKRVEELPLEYLDVVLAQFIESDLIEKTKNGSYKVDKLLLVGFCLIKGTKKIKLIGKTKFNLEVESDFISKGAKESIESNGGVVNITKE